MISFQFAIKEVLQDSISAEESELSNIYHIIDFQNFPFCVRVAKLK